MTDWTKLNLSKTIHDDLIKNLNREMGGTGWMVEDRNKKAYGKDGQHKSDDNDCNDTDDDSDNLRRPVRKQQRRR